jgi:hypothetical protein
MTKLKRSRSVTDHRYVPREAADTRRLVLLRDDQAERPELFNLA